MALFEVLIAGQGPNKSIILPSAAPRGTFWSANTAVAATNNQITAKLGDNADKALLGFNVLQVTSDGLRTDAQILYEEGFEGYDCVDKECSLGPLPELMAMEDDASHTLVQVTAPPTAVGDLCNFEAGKLHKAAATEVAFYQVVNILAGVEDAAEDRFLLKKLDAAIVNPTP